MTDQNTLTSPTIVDPVAIRRELTELAKKHGEDTTRLKGMDYRQAYLVQRDLQANEDQQRMLQLQLQQTETAEATALAAKAHAMASDVAAEIGRADAKAGFAAPVQLVVAGAVASGTAGIDGPLQVAAVVLLLVAVMLASGAVLSRLPRRRPETHHDWMQFATVRTMEGDELAKRLSNDADVADAACLRVVTLSRIAYLKHRLVRLSIQTGTAGLLVAALAALIGAW
ncbi:Pycsar system effector family protein [Kribbella sp. NPDC056345]|uniref:Pycsar system effector family protein n=1 Tax=Kribbella sp. NPDC056345 TaxID=3345789 RepID=UPI0035D93E9E